MDIAKIEILGADIQVKYVDGSREEIAGGLFEAKDANGNRIAQRAATAEDIARLTGLADGWLALVQPLEATVVAVRILGATIDVFYDDGRRESIRDGIYEIKNAANDTVFERPVTEADSARLFSLDPGELGSGAPSDAGPTIWTGTTGDDSAAGDGGSDDMGGGDGNDDMRGRGGDDSLDGGAGDDLLIGDGGDDSMSGGSDDDRLFGGYGDDTLDGGTGDDRLVGGWGNDGLSGGGGDDRLRGKQGDDTLDGGTGDDRVRGDLGDDSVSGGEGNDLVRGDGGMDTVQGGAGDDRVRGGAGNDLVLGGEGNDRVDGQLGDDTLDGGAGADLYNGGAGADVFVFGIDGMRDRISSFEDGVDLIDLTAFGLTGGAAGLAVTQVSPDRIEIDLGGGDVIAVSDWTPDQVDDGDFLF